MRRFACWLFILCLSVTPLLAQETGEIAGVVTDQNGEPLVGVNILVEGTTLGASTDENGRFLIVSTVGVYTLRAEYVGYASASRANITVAAGEKATVNFTLTESLIQGEEMVVIGYGTQRKADVTGSVSSVDVENLQKVPGGDAASLLQGQAAGVNVTPGAGSPGAAPVIRIRGLGTIGDNDPLFIIDGIPADISNLNPGDIESIDVLKDASAATIYGSRAANGVVIVTTKRGKPGQEPRIHISSYTGSQSVTKTMDLANREQYDQISREAFQNAGLDPLEYTMSNTDPNGNPYPDTDWQDAVFNNAPQQNVDFNIAGGTDRLNYYVSGGYFKQDGIVINTGHEKYNFRVNSDYRVKRFKFGQSLSISRSDRNRMIFGDESENAVNAGYSLIYQVLDMVPQFPILDSNNDGGYGSNPHPQIPQGANPVGYLNLLSDRVEDDLMQGNVFGEFEILKGLSFRTRAGLNVANTYTEFHAPTYFMGTQNFNPDASLSLFRGRNTHTILNNVLTYNRNFGSHNLNALAGYSREWNELKSLGGGNNELPSNELLALNSGIGDASSYGSNVTNTLQSFFSRVNYSFKNRYLLQGTIRRDGSSRFSADNRYGTFPSISLGWRLSNESFFNLKSVNDLKLRFSAGTLGNQRIGDFLYLASVSNGGSNLNYPLGSDVTQTIAIGAISTALASSDIKWESTTTQNFGIDLSLFNYKVDLSLDYFNAKTKDMLVRVPIPASTGIVTSPLTNAGELENKGFEAALTYRKLEGKFQFDLTGNFSTSSNKVTRLGFADEAFVDGFLDYANHPTTRTEVGGEIGRFWLYQTDGLFQSQGEVDAHKGSDGSLLQPNAAPGDIRFVDTNGDGVLNDDDKTFFGSGLPDFEYALTFNTRYKNFDFSMFWQGTQGNKMYNGSKRLMEQINRNSNYSTNLLNAWRPDNTNTEIPRNISTDPNDNGRPSDRFLEDASYLRLKNIQLGYRINAGFLNRLDVSKVRFYISAQNILTFTGYSGFDPGLSNFTLFARGVDRGLYPLAKSVVTGFELTF